MSTFTLQVSPGQLMWPRIVQTLGAGLLWVPVNTAAYLYISKEQTNNASGLFNLIRNEGSSIGVSMATTLLQRHTQFHQTWLAGHVTPLHPQATSALQKMSGVGDGVTGMQQGLARLYGLVQREALTLSYLDVFRVFAVASLLVVPLVLLMRRSVAKGGELAAH
jgi:DHA2 family multidrug resistance protein